MREWHLRAIEMRSRGLSYGQIARRRKGIGIELKPSYYRQALKNLAEAEPGAAGKSDQFKLELDDSGNEWPDMVDVA
jgi:hypothetical protein